MLIRVNLESPIDGDLGVVAKSRVDNRIGQAARGSSMRESTR